MGEAKRRALAISPASRKVSLALQEIAHELDGRLEAAAGERVAFSLFVWTDGRANYVASSSDRAEIKRALLSVIDGWDAGMPDVATHDIAG